MRAYIRGMDNELFIPYNAMIHCRPN